MTESSSLDTFLGLFNVEGSSCSTVSSCNVDVFWADQTPFYSARFDSLDGLDFGSEEFSAALQSDAFEIDSVDDAVLPFLCEFTC